MKKKIMMAFILLLVVMVPGYVNATEVATPVYDESDANAPVFYANGTSITISNNDEGALISYGETSVVVSPKTSVYGGGIAGTSFDSSSIVMTGGTVAAIYGGGKGDLTSSADVGSVSIKISGGTVAPYKNSNNKTVNGNVFGGGLLSSNVNTADIQITGGTVFTVVGGGMASANINGTVVGVGNKTNPELSPNKVGSAKISISGGKIYSDLAGTQYGLVFGGGQGYSYVKETEITVSGTSDLSKAWLVGGGSNGRTDYATLNINGGNIKVLQTINRGSMINANVNMTAGTIATLYVGGESPEDFAEDIVNGGFLGDIIVDITGGTVTTLKLGSNYDEDIQKDAEYAKVFYKPTSVTNSATIKETMGSIAKAYTTDNTVVEEVTEDTTITKDLFAALSETDNVYEIIVNDKYGWTFNGSDIVDSTIDVNTSITLTKEAPEEIKTKVTTEIASLKLSDVIFLNFEHHGKLPGKATVTYNVADDYADGTVVYVLHYNEETGKLENEQAVTVTNGKITFEVETCSSYIVSKTAAAVIRTVDNPSTSDENVELLVTMMMIGLGGLGFVFKKAYNLTK